MKHVIARAALRPCPSSDDARGSHRGSIIRTEPPNLPSKKIQDKPRKLGVGDVTMLLYDSPVSGNCYKVRLLLAHLDIPYDRRTVDVVDRSDRPAILGGLNPALRVPTLVLSDGRPLAESNAILWYFGEGTQFVPEERYERAKVLQWMFFEQYEHEPALAVVRFWVAYSGRPEAFADRLDERRAAGYRALDAMQRHLEKNPFLAAGAFSIADIALYAYTHVAHEGGFDLEGYPAITKWLERVAAQPGHITIDA